MGLFERIRSAASRLQHRKTTTRPQEVGQRDDTVASYRHALETDPHNVELHTNLGNALKNRGLLGPAMTSYRSALEIKPDFAIAHHNLAVVLRRRPDRRRDGALSPCARCPARVPAGTLQRGHYPEGARSARRCCGELSTRSGDQPTFAEAHYNLGNALNLLGRHADAAISYRRAIELRPDFADAHSNLGNALQDLSRLDDAVLCYQRALEIKRDDQERISTWVVRCRISDNLTPRPRAISARSKSTRISEQREATCSSCTIILPISILRFRRWTRDSSESW